MNKPHKIKAEHEDLIHKYKTFINELSKVQDKYFKELTNTMGVTELGNDWLFDYVFNDEDYEDFEHYIERFSGDCSIYVGDE